MLNIKRFLGLGPVGLVASLWASVAVVSLTVHLPANAVVRIEQWKEANGARVWLMHTPAIPMVDVQIDWDAGARRDPAGQEGLASSAATMLSRGSLAWHGRNALDEEALGAAWADLGASFDAGASKDRFFINLRSLTEPKILEQAVHLAAQQLAAPAVPSNVWTRVQRNSISALKESQTRPDVVAEEAFNTAVFGAHPYGLRPNEVSLNTITPDSIQAHLKDALRACDAKVSIVGALNRVQASQLVQEMLAGVADKPCSVRAKIAPVAGLTEAKQIDIPFDSAQAQVLVGQPGIARNDPDYFPIVVGNYILGGGGFVSRLTEEVREKRGLTYGVYSYFSPALDRGEFAITLQTRPDQAKEAQAIAMRVLRDFVARGPSVKELKAAKDFMVGGFALNIDTNRKLLGSLSGMAWNDLPLDYLDTWTTRVEKVKREDIRRAYRSVLNPDKMVTVILGASKK